YRAYGAKAPGCRQKRGFKRTLHWRPHRRWGFSPKGNRRAVRGHPSRSWRVDGRHGIPRPQRAMPELLQMSLEANEGVVGTSAPFLGVVPDTSKLLFPIDGQ